MAELNHANDGWAIDIGGDYSVDSDGNISFDDQNLTSPINISEPGVTGLASSFIAMSLMGAINEASSLRVPTTLVSSATYLFLATDFVLLVGYTSTGIVDVTIPSSEIAKVGRIFYIIDSGANSSVFRIKVHTEGSQTIGGDPYFVLEADEGVLMLMAVGDKLIKI